MPGPPNRLAAVFLTFLFFTQIPTAQAAETQDFNSDDYALRAVTVASGLRHPWGMTFLPDGRMLVTEREGDIRIVTMAGDKSSPLKGLPDAYVSGQGGILDVALDPAFPENKLVYVSFSESGPGGAGTAVLRAVLDLDGEALTEGEIIFPQEPKTDGGRLFAWDEANRLESVTLPSMAKVVFGYDADE